MSRRSCAGVCSLILALALLASTVAATASADTAGTVHTVKWTDSAFSQYLEAPSPTSQAWMKSHFWRMGTYSPYFDSKTSWYPNGWVYLDAYALYSDERTASEHPEWVLHGTSGEKLYIPWGCSHGTCPQYAANIASASFRQWWIEGAKAMLSHGYKGLFIDDVNMEFRVGNGAEQQVAPIDPATGQAMSFEAWRRYMAQFMTQVRAALPGIEIVHNAVWYSDTPARLSDPYIAQEVRSADYINLERGVNDSGLTGGSGSFSLNAFLSYVEQVHALGRGIVMGNSAANPQGTSYDLASYFLVSSGHDAINVGGATPQNWWAGWEVQLGEAVGARYQWSGLLRRDFTGGMVLANPPGASSVTVQLPAAMEDPEGRAVTSVTLPAASGAILRNARSSSAPPVPPLEPTRTAVEETKVLTPTQPSDALKAGTGSHPTQAPSPVATPKVTASTTPATPPRPHKRHRWQKHRARAGRLTHRAHTRLRIVPVRVKGIVARATRGPVRLQIETRRGRRWVRAWTATTSIDVNGHFSRLLRLNATQHYRIRAEYLGAAGFRPSRSGYRLIVLHPGSRGAQTGLVA
jgi:Hypothetical glycosyl hydrolase family 15